MRPGRLGSGVACVVAAAWLAAVGPCPALAEQAPYGVIVEEYRSGNADAAVAALFRWDRARLAREARPARLPGDSGMRVAAIALHTEVAIRNTPTSLASAHFEIARSGMASLDASVRTQLFRRAWYVTSIDYLLHWASLVRAGAIIDQIPRDVAEAPETRLAIGRYYEIRAEETSTVGAAARARTTAAWHYQAAISGRSRLVEARLRLGRVLLLLDRTGEAIAELDRVSAETPDPSMRYLARLFVGEAHERAGRVEEALTCYRAALELVPDGQAAHLACGRALLVTGDRPAAAEVAIRILTRDSPASFRPERDPWWTYRQGQPSRLELLVAQMREAVRR